MEFNGIVPYNELFSRSSNFRDFCEYDPIRENLQTIINSNCTCVMASDISYSWKKTIAENSFVGDAERFAKIGILENKALYGIFYQF